MQFDIKIDSVGHKWIQVSVLANTGRYYSAQILKEQLPEVKPGESLTLFGTCECKSDRYKTVRTITVLSEEKAKAFDTEKANARKQADIEKWWGYIQDSANKDGYFYQKGVNKLHELGDTSHDEAILQIKEACDKKATEKEIERWWGYVKDTAIREGKLYQKGMDKLHEYGDHSHDEKVKALLTASKATISEKKWLAFNDSYRPSNIGSAITHIFRNGDIMYLKVLSERYNRADGRSFGVDTEAWWRIEYEDLSETPEGQTAIAKVKHEQEVRKARAEAKKSLETALGILYRKIENKGLFQREDISLDDIRGVKIYDTFNMYGGGLQIVEDTDVVWYVQNNGTDGSAWDLNHIRTGGAGAYGYKIPKDIVVAELETFKKTLATFNEMTEV